VFSPASNSGEQELFMYDEPMRAIAALDVLLGSDLIPDETKACLINLREELILRARSFVQ